MTFLFGCGLAACAPAESPPPSSPAPEAVEGPPTHLYQEASILDGYVSGSLYEIPPYQVKFDKFTLQRWLPLKGLPLPLPLFEAEGPLAKPENDDEDAGVMPADSFAPKDPVNVTGRESEFDPVTGVLIFPSGIEATSDDGFRARADRGVWWTRDGVLYLEGHVEVASHEWRISFEKLVLNLDEHSGWGLDPRMIIRSPSGVLGLGRGSNLPAVVRGKELRLAKASEVRRGDVDGRKEVVVAEGGQAHLGDWLRVPFPKKYSSDVNNPFAGARAGRNSRHGAFVHSRFRLFNGNFSLGDAAVRGRLQLLENWYQKRGFGHGLEGRYNLKFGRANAQGRLHGLIIDDDDDDRKQTPYTRNTRFFGHWIHRGTHPDGWNWNFELSRESDEEMREEFDRKAFRRNKPFQNRVYVAKRFKGGRFSALVQARAEEFDTEVDYLPKFQYDVIDQELSKGFRLEGHVQAANVRLNKEEKRHADAPSIRAERLDILQRLSRPLVTKRFLVEPYAIGSSTWYSRQVDRKDALWRSQLGNGIVLATRTTRGIARFLPQVDARRMFTPSNNSRLHPQMDGVDDRFARETVEFNWRHLVRGTVAGKQRDPWDLDIRITGFPNRHRDNDNKRWSLMDQRFDLRPHRRLEFFLQGEYDVGHKKYRESVTGFTINPDSQVSIGTGSSGRDVFAGTAEKLKQGRGRRQEWAFKLEHRYLESQPAVLTGQIDLLPPDKWRFSYAQEWRLDGTPQVTLHRIRLDHDLHDWTLSLDLESDVEDRSESASINLTPHGWGRF